MPCKPVILIFVMLAVLGVPAFCGAQNSYAPPRNVDDILAVLDQYAAGPAADQKDRLLRAEQAPPETSDKAALAKFYLDRAVVWDGLGRHAQYLADLRLALDNVPPKSVLQGRIVTRLAMADDEVAFVRAVAVFYVECLALSCAAVCGVRGANGVGAAITAIVRTAHATRIHNAAYATGEFPWRAPYVMILRTQYVSSCSLFVPFVHSVGDSNDRHDCPRLPEWCPRTRSHPV